jgi:chromate reductase, NAD(P)H dehydrogenase (quinone)
MTTEPLRVLGISGSLRRGSFNTSLLRAAVEIAEAEKLPLRFDIADLREIPAYDEDVRAEGLPAPVQKLRDGIAAADAILFVTPEYNFSIPGVLKNAIDWVSRPPSQPFANKPFAVMGASGGPSGTMRGQYHLRQIAVVLDMHALNKPEIFVRNAQDLFGADGRLHDEATRKLVAQQLTALVDWTRRLAK